MSKENRQKEYNRLKESGREIPNVLKKEFEVKKPKEKPEEKGELPVEKEQKKLDKEQQQLTKKKK